MTNSETTNLLNSGDTSLSGMFSGVLGLLGLLAVALGGAALGAVSLGFFFFLGDFILLMDLVPHIDFSLSSRIDLFGICLLSMSTGEQTLGI